MYIGMRKCDHCGQPVTGGQVHSCGKTESFIAEYVTYAKELATRPVVDVELVDDVQRNCERWIGGVTVDSSLSGAAAQEVRKEINRLRDALATRDAEVAGLTAKLARCAEHGRLMRGKVRTCRKKKVKHHHRTKALHAEVATLRERVIMLEGALKKIKEATQCSSCGFCHITHTIIDNINLPDYE